MSARATEGSTPKDEEEGATATTTTTTTTSAMDAKIHVEDTSNTNGTTHVFNVEMARGAGEGNSAKDPPGEREDGEIYPDKTGKTMFDRYYLNSGKPIPPYVGLRGKSPAVTWVELFAQQQLPAWRPVITPAQVVLTLVCMGVAMLAVGIGCTVSTMGVVEAKAKYSHLPPPGSLTDFTDEQKSRYLQENGGYVVDLEIPIAEDMEPPVYVYYELTNFYQNNRRYVRSQSSQQLAGISVTPEVMAATCEPALYVTGSPNASFPSEGLVTPCGLQAWSFFNDTFEFSVLGAEQAGANESFTLPVDSSKISWPTDSTFLYGNVTAENFNVYPEYRGGATVTKPLNQEEHFMVWMRLAAKPSFWKLWGVVNERLEAGDVVGVRVLNQFNTYGFGGTKSVVLSTNSWLGNKNYFLGAVYIAMGGIFVVVGVVFQLAYWARPRRFGDHKHLSWNKSSLRLG